MYRHERDGSAARAGSEGGIMGGHHSDGWPSATSVVFTRGGRHLTIYYTSPLSGSRHQPLHLRKITFTSPLSVSTLFPWYIWLLSCCKGAAVPPPARVEPLMPGCSVLAPTHFTSQLGSQSVTLFGGILAGVLRTC